MVQGAKCKDDNAKQGNNIVAHSPFSMLHAAQPQLRISAHPVPAPNNLPPAYVTSGRSAGSYRSYNFSSITCRNRAMAS